MESNDYNPVARLPMIIDIILFVNQSILKGSFPLLTLLWEFRMISIEFYTLFPQHLRKDSDKTGA